MDTFQLVTDLTPKIEQLAKGVEVGKKFQTLLGVRRSPSAHGTPVAHPADSGVPGLGRRL